MHQKFLFQKVCIIGLGLIGASLAQAMLDRKLTDNIVACDFDTDSLDIAKEQGLITHGSSDLLSLLGDCDLVVISVPVKAVLPIFRTIGKAMADGVFHGLITDVCSTKMNVIQAVHQVEGELREMGKTVNFTNFVPAHPIAGAENSGVLARKADLFVAHQLIICPNSDTDSQAIAKISELWQAVGANVTTMTAERHDQVLAHTSHLPHLLSYALTYQLAKDDENLDIFRYAAGGFRDFSRISASSPIMWHDIFLANKQEVLKGLDNYQAILNQLKTAIENDNSDELLEIFKTAKNAREYFGQLLIEKAKIKNS